MPGWEDLRITATLTIMIDGHVLAFTDDGKASGARYHGSIPDGPYRPDETLEARIRDAVAACVATVAGDAGEAVVRLYPVAGDRRRATQSE